MPKPCPPHHERLLESLLAGDPSPAGGERAELEACPRCGPELRELERLAGALDRSAGDERADLEVAAREAGPREEAFVRAVHARHLARRPVLLRKPLLGALLCAAAIALYFLLARREPEPRRPITVLGADGVSELRPDPGDYGGLSWVDASLPVNGYRVEVWAIGEHGETLLDQADTQEPRVVFPAEASAQWPAEVQFRVLELALDGSPRGQASHCSARRP